MMMSNTPKKLFLAMAAAALAVLMPGLCLAQESAGTAWQSSDAALYPPPRFLAGSSPDDAASPAWSMETAQTLSDIHAVLGYATVVMGLATGICTPDLVGYDAHEVLGYTSAGLAGLSLVSGFVAHIGDIGTDPSLGANTIHALIGIAGGGLMVASPFIQPDKAHRILGEIGTALMGISIVWKLAY